MSENRLSNTTPAKARKDSPTVTSEVSVAAVATSLQPELEKNSGKVVGLWEKLVGREEDTPWPDEKVKKIQKTMWGDEKLFEKGMIDLGHSRYYRHGDKLLRGSWAEWKPDFVLIRTNESAPALSDGGNYQRVNTKQIDPAQVWQSSEISARRVQQVLVPIEAKKGGKSLESVARKQISRSLQILMTNQPGRLFAVGFTVVNQSFTLYFAHSSGLFWSPAVSAADEPRKVGHMLWKLTQMTSTQLGLIPELSPLDVLQPSQIAIIDDDLAIERVLLYRRTITGRGTVALLLSRQTDSDKPDRKRFVLKFYWREQSRGSVEDTVLASIDHARNISSPSVGAATSVDVGTTNASLANLPSTCNIHLPFMDSIATTISSTTQEHFADSSNLFENLLKAAPAVVLRSFTAVKLQPAGQPLKHFRSDVELLGVMIDAIKAHRDLHGLGYLHRDISASNILIRSGTPARGLLIDFDLAANLNETAPSTSGHRTGTLPFMAISLLQSAVLKKPSFTHKIDHDLESFFWVLIWTCLRYEEPNPTEGESAVVWSRNDEMLQRWNTSTKITRDAKGQFLGYGWEDEAEAAVAPYWLPTYNLVLNPLRNLFEAFVRSGGAEGVGYKAMLEIMEDGKHELETRKKQ